MKVTIPITNKLSLNKIYGGIHFHTRKKHKDEYRHVVWATVREKYTGTYPVHITYDFQFKGRRLDASNCGYLVKLIEDGLVQCEVIPDDSPKYVAGFTAYSTKGDNEVVVTIEPHGTSNPTITS